MSQNIYQGRNIIKTVQIEKNRVFNSRLKFSFILGRYNHIIKANKKNTSYLNHRNPDIFGSKNGKYIYIREDIINEK
jgi:hypothetical protein